MSRKNVGILLTSIDVGGVSSLFLDLIRAMNPDKVNWMLAASSCWSDDIWLGKFASEIMYGTGPMAIEGLKAHCDAIIIGENREAAYYLADYEGKVIFLSHGSGTWSRQAFNASAPVATHLAAVSTACKRAFPARYQDQVEVVLSGCDPVRILPTNTREALRAKHGIPQKAVCVAYIGRYSPEKNWLAPAMYCGESGKWAIYQGYPTSSDAEDFQERINGITEGRCTFIDRYAHVGDTLSMTDVLMMPSREEGFSIGIIEAWLAGVPVVSTPVGILDDRSWANDIGSTISKWASIISHGASTNEIERSVESALSGKNSFDIQSIRASALGSFSSQAMAKRWETYLDKIFREEELVGNTPSS